MNGFYSIIKPINMSSSDLVIKLRGLLRSRTGIKYKVGHLGTLDPMASGVLGIAVGNATKLFDFFLNKKKEYIATLTLGTETDTLDIAGQIVRQVPVCDVSTEQFESVCKKFVGEIMQVPPIYSAKSVSGVRAYKLARAGESIELAPKKVVIDEISLIKRLNNCDFLIKIKCSSGTYIRSLCRDIGADLGYPSYMSSLVRTVNGIMTMTNSVQFADIEKDISVGFIPIETFAEDLPKVNFSENLRKKIDNGVKQNLELADTYVSVSVGDKFYGIGQIIGGVLNIIARA